MPPEQKEKTREEIVRKTGWWFLIPDVHRNPTLLTAEAVPPKEPLTSTGKSSTADAPDTK